MGILANRPMAKDDIAETAAVAVTRSRFSSWMHDMYAGSLSHASGLSGGQTQVPPLWDVMEAEISVSTNLCPTWGATYH